MTPESEEWRHVAGWEGVYEISDLGRARSQDRVIVRRNGVHVRHRGRILRPRPAATRAGKPVYETVILCPVFGDLRPRRTAYIHSMVMEAFGPPRPSPDHVVRHYSGDHSDNAITNLRWGTHSENNYDIVRHGRSEKRRRTQCPIGHALQAPNLVACKSRLGHRNCLACSRARAAMRKAKNAGRPFDLQRESDVRYAQIMKEAA